MKNPKAKPRSSWRSPTCTPQNRTSVGIRYSGMQLHTYTHSVLCTCAIHTSGQREKATHVCMASEYSRNVNTGILGRGSERKGAAWYTGRWFLVTAGCDTVRLRNVGIADDIENRVLHREINCTFE